MLTQHRFFYETRGTTDTKSLLFRLFASVVPRVNITFFAIVLLLPVVGAVAQTKKLPQGISGVVLWKKGNFMPSPDVKVTKQPKALPVAREVYIFELTNSKQAEATDDPTFYKNINTRLLRKVKSDPNGRFWVRLPAGYYSVFVKEPQGYYANLFDDAMNLNPVQVKRGKWTKTEVVIDYEAVY
jgi:hypothetical protein